MRGLIVGAFQAILQEGRKPEKVQSDAGTEFDDAQFQKLSKSNDINFSATNSELEACVVERLNRTLKERLRCYFTKNNTYTYIDILQNLVDGYDTTKHGTIGMAPINVNHANEADVLQKAYTIEKSNHTFKFNVGDKVRISKVKSIFEKGYVPNWSEETFVVLKCIRRTPVVYELKDQLGEKLEEFFL